MSFFACSCAVCGIVLFLLLFMVSNSFISFVTNNGTLLVLCISTLLVQNNTGSLVISFLFWLWLAPLLLWSSYHDDLCHLWTVLLVFFFLITTFIYFYYEVVHLFFSICILFSFVSLQYYNGNITLLCWDLNLLLSTSHSPSLVLHFHSPYLLESVQIWIHYGLANSVLLEAFHFSFIL